ncbi:MAG: hypothetical protein ACFFCP_09885 [Promethearchaeota archaeon]
MKSVRVLILGSNDSTLISTIRTLQKSSKYDFTIFGFGSENEFIERFYNVTLLRKSSSDLALIHFLIDACQKNKVEVIIPTSFEYLEPLCEHLEIFRSKNIEPAIPLTDPSLLEILSHRPTLFEYFNRVLSLNGPEYRISSTQQMLHEGAHSLGYPHKPILFTPSHSFRGGNMKLVESSKDVRKLFFEKKPDTVYSTLHQFTNVLGVSFPEVTAIEFDCVTEYSVEVLCRKGITFAVLVYPSNPLSAKMDIRAALTKDQHYPAVEKIARRVIEGFGFSYSVCMRIWIDSEGNAKLVDVIPHLREDVILCFHGGVNFPELMIDMALQEFDYEYNPTIKWGLKMQQVWLELLSYQGDVWKTDL